MSSTERQPQPEDGTGDWTLLSTHARVLVEIARDPDVRIRDLAVECDMTERAVQRIVADLEQAGYLSHTRVGRRNRYTVNTDQTFRHHAHADYPVGPLLDLLTAPATDRNRDRRPRHPGPKEA
jgi:DNA-binding MarR family transcriptional regulator